MSNTHKIHSPAGADVVPSIISSWRLWQGCQVPQAAWPGAGMVGAEKGFLQEGKGHGGWGAIPTCPKAGRSPKTGWGHFIQKAGQPPGPQIESVG
jgi:hypothetical protein